MNIEEKLGQIIKNQEKLLNQQQTLIKIMGNKGFLKVREAALIYQVGRRKLYKAIESRELKSYRPNGRDFLIKASELEQWILEKQY